MTQEGGRLKKRRRLASLSDMSREAHASSSADRASFESTSVDQASCAKVASFATTIVGVLLYIKLCTILQNGPCKRPSPPGTEVSAETQRKFRVNPVCQT